MALEIQLPFGNKESFHADNVIYSQNCPVSPNIDKIDTLVCSFSAVIENCQDGNIVCDQYAWICRKFVSQCAFFFKYLDFLKVHYTQTPMMRDGEWFVLEMTP